MFKSEQNASAAAAAAADDHDDDAMINAVLHEIEFIYMRRKKGKSKKTAKSAQKCVSAATINGNSVCKIGKWGPI